MPRPLAEAEGLPPGRETQIKFLAGKGYTDPQIAERLGIRPSTVAVYWRRTMQAEGARTRTQVVVSLHVARVKRLRSTLRLRDAKIERLQARVAELESLMAQQPHDAVVG